MANKRVCFSTNMSFANSWRHFYEKEICETSKCEVRKFPLRHPNPTEIMDIVNFENFVTFHAKTRKSLRVQKLKN